MIALRIMGEIVAVISVPVTVLTRLANWIENRVGGKTQLLAAAVLISFVTSTVTLCLRAVRYGQMYISGNKFADESEKTPADVDVSRRNE